MTELENARAYLAESQDYLRDIRRQTPAWAAPGLIGRAESGVLAALSWVWDAQERSGFNRRRREERCMEMNFAVGDTVILARLPPEVPATDDLGTLERALQRQSLIAIIGRTARILSVMGCEICAFTGLPLCAIEVEGGQQLWASPDMLDQITTH
jgi:hypothetical protein